MTEKELIKLKQTIMYENFLNARVLVRSYDAGVYFGTLVAVEGESCKLENVRNIWKWEGATCLSQIANEGITGGRVSQPVGSMVLNRVCQIIPLTDVAIANLDGQKVWRV